MRQLLRQKNTKQNFHHDPSATAFANKCVRDNLDEINLNILIVTYHSQRRQVEKHRFFIEISAGDLKKEIVFD